MKEVRGEVDFGHADKHQSFQQVDYIFFDGLIELCHGNNLLHMSIKDY